MYDALYARQSVERADSISIESQLEYCKFETRGQAYKEYIDRGYSGKNTNRPAFEEMLEDIRQGKVARVIVYKLDRVSRSILDFANMMDVFQKYRVEFVSSTERFDTSTPIGRAMLNICIVFAQLERETIQKRVSDAYYSRSKRGFYMGGKIPYGFARQETVIDGIKTAMYVPVPEEAEHIRIIFSMYADPRNSLRDIIAYFAEHGMDNRRCGIWYPHSISFILRNPIYVQADAEVYAYYKSQGANIINPASDFIGRNACYLYQGAESEANKQSSLTGKELVLAPHEGLVPSDIWLKCRLRCQNNRRLSSTNKPKNSWLLGKVKCGHCGYSLKLFKSGPSYDPHRRRHFGCSLSRNTKKTVCPGAGGTIYADVVEDYILGAIREKLKEFRVLAKREEQHISPKVNENKIRLMEVEQEIDDLLAKVSGANPVLLDYINKRIESLDAERNRLREENLALAHQMDNTSFEAIENHVEKWDEAAFEDRQAVVDALIKVIKIANGEIEVTWNI